MRDRCFDGGWWQCMYCGSNGSRHGFRVERGGDEIRCIICDSCNTGPSVNADEILRELEAKEATHGR